MKTVGDAFKISVFPYIQDQIFRNGDGRQSAKKAPNRHAEHKPNTGAPRYVFYAI